MSNKKICGIYCIENLVNGKRYVGQSIDIISRWRHHKSELNRGRHENIHLQNSWNKYGEDGFEFFILHECNIDELNEFEKYYIEYFDSYKNGYNRTLGGSDKTSFTKEFGEKISATKLAFSEEKKLKIKQRMRECFAIPLYQIDLQGNIVNIWNYGARQASEELGIFQSCIWNCINNKRKTYKGFIWIKVSDYDEDTFDVEKYITYKIKPNAYDMFDLDGKFIKHFDSCKDLKNDNLDPSSVLKCAKGHIKKYKGYIFKISR